MSVNDTKKPPGHSVVDETTPLIASSEAGPILQPNEDLITRPDATQKDDDDDDDRPLPKAQVLFLCYARMVEPIAFFSVFPFINKMIWETGGLEEADVGFYSGLIESLFSLTQMLLMISWGRAADRFGRKPILVICLLGCGVGTGLFGLSQTVWQMILCRCFAGVFAGMLVTLRAMFSEISTKKTQARAFSFFAFSGNVGIFMGPLIGGGLSEPATQYPAVFGKSQFLIDYPYALGTLVSAGFAVSAAIITALFVDETLTRNDSQGPQDPPMSTWELLKAPGVAIVLYIYGHCMLLALAYTAVAPVFWFTAVSLGGYGFQPIQISIFLGIAGVSQALWTLIALTPLQRRIGTGAVLRACFISWPTIFIVSPIGNIMLKHGLDKGFWIVLPIFTVLGSGVSMAFTGVQLALNDIAPSHNSLGTLNAIALTFVSGIRAVAPALFASLFAIGAREQILDGYLVWLILVILAVILIVLVRWLPKKAEGKLMHASDDEEN